MSKLIAPKFIIKLTTTFLIHPQANLATTPS